MTGQKPTAENLVRRAQLDAERLVGIVRVVVALMLGFALAISVLPEAPESNAVVGRQIQVAALTLLGYGLVGIAAFGLSVRNALTQGMTWLFATLDVAFILISVFLGLSNAGLAANFASALPAIWLVPLVLAFGALRYNPYLQAYVGGLLVVGLPLAASFAGDWGTVRGTTEPSGLGLLFDVPPNIMRDVMLMIAGSLLVVGAWRTRRLLKQAIAETRRRTNLTRFLPTELAETLGDAADDRLRTGQRQNAAILFLDIRDFTQRAEAQPPEAVSAELGRFRSIVLDTASRHGGVVDKFVGDSALVVFGVPKPQEEDAARSLRCLRDLLAMIAQQDGRWHVGVGLHWGEVFTGAIGDERRLEFTVLGDTVNVAARLQEATKGEKRDALVSQSVLDAARLVPDGLELGPLIDRPVRGRTQTVPAATAELALKYA